MSKLTKLTLVQKILSMMDAESVQSIGDTIESEQVADFVETAYDEILSEFEWPFLYTGKELELTPELNIMMVPEDMYNISWIRYNKRFVEKIPNEDMVILLENQGGPIENQDPRFWTTVDDKFIIFNSYDQFLVPNLSLVYGIKIPKQMNLDEDVPEIPERFHNVLLHLAASMAMYNLKGDDSLGRHYYGLYKRGIVKMKRWAQMFNTIRRTNVSVDYGRRKSVRRYDNF